MRVGSDLALLLGAVFSSAMDMRNLWRVGGSSWAQTRLSDLNWARAGLGHPGACRAELSRAGPGWAGLGRVTLARAPAEMGQAGAGPGPSMGRAVPGRAQLRFLVLRPGVDRLMFFLRPAADPRYLFF